MTVSTPALTLRPAENLAFTEEEVVIAYPHGRVDAIGMTAYVDKNRLQLLSKVRVRHDPIPRG